MHTLRKRHSWPPLRKPRSFHIKDKVDEDPFAYFISPAEDRDVFTDNGLAAGINNDRRCRSLSPFENKAPRFVSAAESTNSPVAKLKAWILRMERHYFHRKPESKETPTSQPSHTPETSSPSIRGRRDIRTSPSHRVVHNQRSPGSRPRSWRAPDVDIWPLAEEHEELGLGITV